MYIDQFKSSKYNYFLYLPFPLLFFGLMALNLLAIYLLKLDVNTIMQQEIANKGMNRFFVESLIPFVVGLGLLFLWVKFVQKQSLVSFTTSRKSIDWKRILFSFTVWAIFQIAVTYITFKVSPEDFVINFDASKFFKFLLIALLLIPIQTSFEEYLFRAHIMQGVGLATSSKLIALLFTSITFGLMHIGNPEVEKMGYFILIYYVGTGLFLGIITLMDEGLELALGFHCANNLIGALLVTSSWSAFQTHSILKDVSEPSAGFEIMVPVFVLFPLLIFLFAKKYKWSNWSEKLAGKVKELPTD